MAAKIRRDDEVIVLQVKTKAKLVKFLKFLLTVKVLVEGVNYQETPKAKPIKRVSLVVLLKRSTIQVSNVAILNPATGKADRVGFRVEDGKKVRFFKSNNEL